MCQPVRSESLSNPCQEWMSRDQTAHKVNSVAALSTEQTAKTKSLKGRVSGDELHQWAEEAADYINSAECPEKPTRPISAQTILHLMNLLWVLDIDFQRLERIARLDEREQQLKELQNIVDNHKSLGNFMFTTGLTTGILGILSGAVPIAGHMKGKGIIDLFSQVPFMSSLSKYKTDKQIADFFANTSKMLQSGSQISDTTSKIRSTFSEGERTFYHQMKDIHHLEGEEKTRGMDELKQNMRSIESFLREELQREQSLTDQLYR